MATADFAVVGAGVVGLAIARQLLASAPDSRVVVLDKEPRLAAHASGRNSGVLHAGFYYSPDSLKARLTARGNRLLHQFCTENHVPVRQCGKVVVARCAEELPRLRELARRGAANGVRLELVDEAGLRELEPLARTVGQALFSPDTAVADPAAVVEALAADVVRRGGSVLLGQEARRVEPGLVVARGTAWSVGHIVNCAGLNADRIASQCGMCDDYVVLPFKGVYRYGNWEPGRLQRHVYPVPDPRHPFLGVHATVTVAGRVKIGPTAIPVLSRENYRWLRGLRAAEVPATAAGLGRFLRSDTRAAWGLIRTETPKLSHRALARDAGELVPEIRAADFTERGRPGIRAQLARRDTGALEMDFVVRGDEATTHVLNAVSPAWTGALAFAEHVVAEMRTRGAV